MSNENKDANHYIIGPYPTKTKMLTTTFIGPCPTKTKMLTTTS